MKGYNIVTMHKTTSSHNPQDRNRNFHLHKTSSFEYILVKFLKENKKDLKQLTRGCVPI